MMIFFEQLEVDYILTKDCPTRSKPIDVAVVVPGTSTDAIVVTTPITSKDAVSISVSTTDIDKFEKDNKTICWHLLNHMTASLFDLFVV